MVQKRNQFLTYSLPLIDKEEIQEVTETLESGWLSKGTEFGFQKADFPIAMNDYKRPLSIPLSDEDVHDVIKAVQDIVKGAG